MTELHRRGRDLLATAREGRAQGPTPAQRSRMRASLIAQAGIVAAGAVATTHATGAAATAGAGGTATVGTNAAAAVVAEASAHATVAGLSTGAGFVTAATAATKVVAVMVLALGVGGGGYAAVSHFTGETSVARASRVLEVAAAAPTPVARTAAPRPPEPSPAMPVAPAAAPPPPAPVAPTPPRAVAASTPVSAPSTPSTFEAETRALSEALTTLRDGHGEATLAALDAQDSLYADGALGEEREAARIEALCLLGRGDQARAAAGRFLAAHPRSLLAARVKGSCGGGAAR